MLARDLHAHAACGAFDHLHRALEARRVQVVHLRLGDLLHRRPADLPDLLLVRLARALLDASLFADEVGIEKGSGKDRKSTRLNSSHVATAYAVFCSKEQTPVDRSTCACASSGR